MGVVLVAPGQKRREDTWNDMLRSLGSGKIKLIIHIVSWGYHSFAEESYTRHPLYQNGMTGEQFVERYAEDCRDRELEILRRLEPHLSVNNKGKTVMITLATKQDLWWDNRQEMKEHYMDGEYNRLIEDLGNKLGTRTGNFTHEYCSAALVRENLVSGQKELLKPVTQGYDDQLRNANLRQFINTIERHFNIYLKV